MDKKNDGKVEIENMKQFYFILTRKYLFDTPNSFSGPQPGTVAHLGTKN
jgi:hypothetical protein